MKRVTLAMSALAAFALSAGVAAAQMQPVPNPPEHHMAMGHHMMKHHMMMRRHMMTKHHMMKHHMMMKHDTMKPK